MKFNEIVKFTTNEEVPVVLSKEIEKLSVEELDSLTSNMWNDLLDDVKIKSKPVKVMLNNKKVTDYTFSSLIIQLIYWRPLVLYRLPIEQDDFYNTIDIKSSVIHSSIDRIMEKLLDRIPDIKMDELSEVGAKIIEELMKMVEVWAKIDSSSISLYSIIRLCKRDSDIRYLINSDVDENLGNKEIEQHIQEKYNLFKKKVIEDGKSCLAPHMATKRFKDMQAAQMFCNVGNRADSNGYVLSVPFKGNFLRGYANKTDQFLESITGRDALIVKDKYVAMSGALSRQIDLICLNTNINHDVEDCGTIHYLEVNVASPNILKMIHEKFMINEDFSLHKIDKKKDHHLIGKTIKIRSHICCCLPAGQVCKTCYGAKSPRLVNTNIGGLPSIRYINIITQMAMSKKHATQTHTSTIKNEYLDKYFRIEGGRCYVRDEIDVSNAILLIDKDYLEESYNSSKDSSYDEYGLDDDGAMQLQLEGLKLKDKIYNPQTRTLEDVEYMLDDNSVFLLLNSELLEKRKLFNINISDEYAYLPLSKLDKEIPVFDLLMITEEVSLYLKQMTNCINTNSRTKAYPHYHAMVEDLVTIIDRIGITISINHIETIIYNLIKDPENILNRPDFTKENPKYQIETLGNTLHAKDIYTSLSTGYIKRQMSNPNTFTKNTPGIFDPFFKNRPKPKGMFNGK